MKTSNTINNTNYNEMTDAMLYSVIANNDEWIPEALDEAADRVDMTAKWNAATGEDFEPAADEILDRLVQRAFPAVHITIHSNTEKAKMAGFRSISTNHTTNPFCIARHEKGCGVCKHCFAYSLGKARPTVVRATQRNSVTLQNHLLRDVEIPKLKDKYFRFESFGDLANETQLRNYFRIAEANPNTSFALWTKNNGIVDRVLASGETIPENLRMIFSSLELNEPAKRPVWADKTFTVYTKDYVAEHNVATNCGQRQCKDCLLCYTKNGVTEIKELLK